MLLNSFSKANVRVCYKTHPEDGSIGAQIYGTKMRNVKSLSMVGAILNNSLQSQRLFVVTDLCLSLQKFLLIILKRQRLNKSWQDSLRNYSDAVI
jgi:hypothetical protein